jgi:hypothetical protein
MSLPNKLYRLHIVPGGTPLKYRQPGGGTFSSLKDMQFRREQLDRQGTIYEIYETDTDWKQIDQSPQEDN